MTDDALLEGAIARCEIELGPADIAVHAAGMSGGHSIVAADNSTWEKIFGARPIC
jgi:hypothetical protein